jgi:endonuclease/exonuclease/phosphatase family metal-dependent hydrolase
MTTIKILQLNIWGGRLGQQVINLINEQKPDIVCLQEVTRTAGGNAFLVTDIEEINESCNYPHLDYTAQFQYNLQKRKAEGGLAILSTLPFANTTSFFTRGEYVDDFDLSDTDYNIRALQHVAVVLENGKTVHILNHHGHHLPNHKQGDEETLRQCQMIVDYVMTLDGPAVLCGDFNLIPTSASLEKINTILSNHALITQATTTRTNLTHKTEVCDYIFTSPELETANFQILDDIASDHKALTIEIKL